MSERAIAGVTHDPAEWITIVLHATLRRWKLQRTLAKIDRSLRLAQPPASSASDS